jgi:hypothetical protein
MIRVPKNTENGFNSVLMLAFENCFDVFIFVCAEKTESTNLELHLLSYSRIMILFELKLRSIITDSKLWLR